MNPVTAWLNTAGDNAIDYARTTELLSELSRTEGQGRRTHLINKICTGNLKLVYSTVKKYSDKRNLRWGTDLSADLLQVGYFGLRDAVERYDPSRGTRLSTIAVSWIRQRVGRHLINKEQAVYVPEHLVSEVNYFKKHGEWSNSKRRPKNTRLLEQAVYACTSTYSLDKTMEKGKEGTTVTLGDILEAPDRSNTAAEVDAKLNKVQKLMDKAGIPTRTQLFLLKYAECGNKVSALRAAGLKGDATDQFKAAIKKIQAFV